MLAAGKWAIGVDTDQALSLPEYSKAILTSAQKAIDVAVLETIKKNAGGDMGGENFLGTLANSGVLHVPVPRPRRRRSRRSSRRRSTSSRRTSPSGAIKVSDYLK